MVDTTDKENVAAAVPVPTGYTPPHVDWPAIFAGALVAAAIAFVLGAFGSAIGLSLVSPFRGEGTPATLMLIAIGIWTLWVAASSFMAGGYLAGRLRRRVADASEHEVDIRDGCHGLVVWGLGVLIGGALLATGIQTTAKVGTTATAAATASAAAAATTAKPGQLQYYVNRMMRADDPSVTTASAARNSEVARILERRGTISKDDRAYLGKLVAAQTKLPADQAAERVNATLTSLEEAETQARLAADIARKVSVIAAFLLAASLLIGAAGAWWGARMGGRHRDEQTVFAAFSNRRRILR